MSNNRYKYFKWTPKTARVTFAYVFLIPSIFLYIGYKTEVCSLSHSYLSHDRLWRKLLNGGLLMRSAFIGKIRIQEQTERRSYRGVVVDPVEIETICVYEELHWL
jgi:hypothetical protein